MTPVQDREQGIVRQGQSCSSGPGGTRRTGNDAPLNHDEGGAPRTR